MYIDLKSGKHAVRTIPDGKESAMERNETESTPAARKEDLSGSGRRTGSNKLVIVIWVTFLLGGVCWFTYCQQKKYAEAERLLNESYTLHGQGDVAGSTDLLRQSAELGNAWAQLYYGERLKNGFGTDRNLPESVKWLQKAAWKKCAEACYQLGVSYENGEGVDRDLGEAEAWYRKALDDPGFVASAQSALDRIASLRSADGADAN